MFPLHDENPTSSTPIATYTIIGLNITAWAGLQGLGLNPMLAESICAFGLVPGEFLGKLAPGVEIYLGENMACVADSGAAWITPITSMFMHGSWLHLIINMWFLMIFGDNVEDVMGVGRFFAFYLFCGLGAGGLQMLTNPTSAIPLIGASGAIGGIMGAYALLFPQAPVHMLIFLGFFITRIVIPAYLMLGYWFLLQLLSALPAVEQETGGTAFWAHVGGFIAGLLLVHIFCSADRLEVCREKKKKVKRLFGKVP
jgi:membrane associated rhomboid family serine protease